MSDGLVWLQESFPEGFTVAFCEGLSPQGFIEALGGELNSTLMLTRDQSEAIELYGHFPEDTDLEAFDLDKEELNDMGFLRPDTAVLRFGAVNNWAFAIQSFGSFAAAPGVALHASAGRRYISFSRTANMACWFQYVIDGEVANSFDPLHPVQGRAGGLAVEEISVSDDPVSAVLCCLESQLSLSIPKSSDFDYRIAAAFGGDM
ncbi:DUF6461 domain-containing protein [Streptomyces sp. CNZ748]|uniref:DUF6461 domain-containing protein n=1 Tax=Streptomyces sp. CNZ748 TaxID=2885160 RepID=UPI001E286124|nr:DUF6461 domain-containing protein [Streptomyces sp. CNZ748]